AHTSTAHTPARRPYTWSATAKTPQAAARHPQFFRCAGNCATSPHRAGSRRRTLEPGRQPTTNP
ncbi:hypothetical protein ACWD3Z_04250, partial [Streptomyces sp. NPDC002740]